MREKLPEPTKETPTSPEVEKRHMWTAIMGVPACGKTTMARLIGKELGFSVMEELDVTRLPIFQEYYKNPDEYALPFQILIWDETFRELVGDENTFKVDQICKSKPLISEPPIWQHPLYAQARLESQPQQFEIYRTYIEGVTKRKNPPTPDFVFYAYMDFDYMYQRICERAETNPLRKSELEAPISYWQRLWNLHEEWIRKNPLNLRIIKINMALFDYKFFRTREDSEAEFITEFKNWISYETKNPQTGELRDELVFKVPEIILNHRPEVQRIS